MVLSWTLVLVGSTVSTAPAHAAPPDPPPPVQVAVPPMATEAASMVQTDFGTESLAPGNVDLVVPQGGDLVHYWRANSQADLPWHRAETITDVAAGPASLIQSSIGRAGTGTHGDLEVVVREGSKVVHYFRESGGNYVLGWQKGQTFGGEVVGPPAIIQSDFKPTNLHGSFEVVVPEQLATPTGPVVALVHYTHPNPDRNASKSTAGRPWQRENDGAGQARYFLPGVNPVRPALIQSDTVIGGHGRIEVLANRGGTMNHLGRDLSIPTGAWTPLSTFGTGLAAGPSFLQSTFLTSGHGNYEAAVVSGTDLEHWWRPGAGGTTWRKGPIAMGTGVRFGGSLIQTTIGRTATVRGRFEVVAPAGDAPPPLSDSRLRAATPQQYHLFHGYRSNNAVTNPWIVDPDPVTHWERSARICQLTGEKDEETGVVPANPAAWGQPTVLQTATRYNLGFTDLGFPVEENPADPAASRIRFYFGDSNNRFHLPNLGFEFVPDDAVGVSGPNPPAPTPTRCPAIWIPNSNTPQPLPPAARSTWTPLTVQTAPGRLFYQGLLNVPTSGFTVPGPTTGTRTGYTFFFTDSCLHTTPDLCAPNKPANTSEEGRAVLTRNQTLQPAGGDSARYTDELSLPKPFNVAINAVNASANPALPADRRGVYVYTLDRYRESYPRLLFLPNGAPADVAASWRFLDRVDDTGDPVWLPWAGNDPEAEADRLFTTGDPNPGNRNPGGCMGEMSVSWVGPLSRWVMLYNCWSGALDADGSPDPNLDPGRVRARVADKPWGPWSDPVDIFDPRPDRLASDPGYTGTRGDGAWCRFMYMPADRGLPHPPCTGALNDNLGQPGTGYGPYVIDRYTKPANGGAEIVFTLSTWNPYNVVLMKANLVAPR
jgi:hypothetical protein